MVNEWLIHSFIFEGFLPIYCSKLINLHLIKSFSWLLHHRQATYCAIYKMFLALKKSGIVVKSAILRILLQFKNYV